MADDNHGGSNVQCLEMSAEIADSQMAEVVVVAEARLSRQHVGLMMVVMMIMTMKQSSFVNLFEYEG